MKATKIDSQKDAADVLRTLADGRSYDRLRSEFAHISNSKGSWWGWLTGTQDPRLSSFLRVVNALGGEVLVRRRSPKEGDSRSGKKKDRRNSPKRNLDGPMPLTRDGKTLS